LASSPFPAGARSLDCPWVPRLWIYGMKPRGMFMRYFPQFTMLAAAAVGAVLGFAAARYAGISPDRLMGRSEAGSQAASAAPERAASHAPPAMPDAAWLDRADRMDWDTPDPAAVQALSAAVATRPALRAAVLQRYRAEPRPAAKDGLRQVLATAGESPELVAAALQLAQHADAAARADGYRLLAELSPREEAYALARRALVAERDPAALAGALMCLRPMEMVPPKEMQHVLQRLQALNTHPSPQVRGHSVQKLAEWDRSQTLAAGAVARALTDPDAEVREAAVGAVSIASLRSGPIKQAVLRILGNASEDPRVRGAALLVSEQFALTQDEYAAYVAGREGLIEKEKTRAQAR